MEILDKKNTEKKRCKRWVLKIFWKLHGQVWSWDRVCMHLIWRQSKITLGSAHADAIEGNFCGISVFQVPNFQKFRLRRAKQGCRKAEHVHAGQWVKWGTRAPATTEKMGLTTVNPATTAQTTSARSPILVPTFSRRVSVKTNNWSHDSPTWCHSWRPCRGLSWWFHLDKIDFEGRNFLFLAGHTKHLDSLEKI